MEYSSYFIFFSLNQFVKKTSYKKTKSSFDKIYNSKHMKKILLLSFFIPCLIIAQPALQPHIGLTSAPQLTDPICIPPVYTGEMDTSGYAEGDIVADFTLYKANGDSVRLSDALATGVPVLLVAGNYTCPVFRDKIADLNDITNYYAGQLQVYLVYGIEAHPIVDPSPYSGFVWTTSENYSEGVLYEQPDTYGDRLTLLDSLLVNHTIVPEILIDGPCNEWWLNFGPAPNNAYLIDTNGVVRAKQGWFNRAPENMWCEIDTLLGTNSGNCIVVGNNGTFSFTLDDDDIDYDAPGSVLSIDGMLRNLSATDNVKINIGKQFIDIPPTWGTALCADICYSPSVTLTNVVIAPGDSLPFIFYFYTGATADSGFVRVRFKNIVFPATNTVEQEYFGVTEISAGIADHREENFIIYPNPTKDNFFLDVSAQMIGKEYAVYNQLGVKIRSGKIKEKQTEIVTHDLPPGMYYLRIGDYSKCYKIIRN